MAAATATSTRVHIVPSNTGLLKAHQTDDAAKKATELLQEDIEQHHVYFNNEGFHNHIVHHLLALYGTGADTHYLQLAYDRNASYQRRPEPEHGPVAEQLAQSWDSHAGAYLGKEEHYADFLRFFQREIAASQDGWRDVLARRVFAGTPAAEDLLVRLFSGFLHPLIQLMYAVEWDQPAIAAAALAQACVHDNWIKDYLLPAEERAQEAAAGSQEAPPPPTIASLYEAVAADEKLARAAHIDDPNKIRDGVLARAGVEMLAIARRVRVAPEELEERTAEMCDAALYMAAAAAMARHPAKMPKFDFFLIHHVNSAPIFLSFNAQSWIPTPIKVRLLEWKIRMDLAQYAARGCPALSMDKITSYAPREAAEASPNIIAHLRGFDDDGHAIKLGRASLVLHNLLQQYRDKDWLKLKDDETWLKVHHMIVDSVESGGPHWVRGAGFDKAWKEIPDGPRL